VLQGVEVGDLIQLGRVLGHKADGEFKFGQPYLEGVTVEAQILEEFRGPKVRTGCCV
jgi:ribosomal protein L21